MNKKISLKGFTWNIDSSLSDDEETTDDEELVLVKEKKSLEIFSIIRIKHNLRSFVNNCHSCGAPNTYRLPFLDRPQWTPVFL